MHVVFFEINSSEKSYFQKHLPGLKLEFYKEKLGFDNLHLAKNAGVISVFIGSKISTEIMKQLPKLKAVVTRSTGIDHIDKDYCQQNNITILNVPHYGVNTVAEHTFALILALSRNIIPSVEATKKGIFNTNGLTGFDLNGKTIGIIGFGNIGTKVAKLAHAFEMKVLVHTRTVKDVPNVKFVSLDELLTNSDIISIHAPLTPETHHLINKNNIKLIKKGAILVNTARGPIVATEALVFALQNKILKGAALDVLEEEQTIKEERLVLTEDYIELSSVKTLLLDHVLRDMPNVIITPHNAFNSKEAILEINQKTVENILSLAGKN